MLDLWYTRAKSNDRILLTPSDVNWPGFPTADHFRSSGISQAVHSRRQPALQMLRGTNMISLKLMGSFFPPTTTLKGMSNDDQHLPTALLLSPEAVTEAPDQSEGQPLSLLGSTAVLVATGEDSIKKHLSQIPKSYSIHNVWLQCCLLASFLAFHCGQPSILSPDSLV